MFRGVFTAVVTPFKNGRVDFDALGRLLEFNLSGGVKGIVACGTTGETPTLDESEYKDVISFAVEKVKPRGKLIAGAGANSTEKSVKNAGFAKDAGADAILVVTPYYNKPTQKGLTLHYEKIAHEVDIPLIVYNVPGRTGVNLMPETLEKLSRLKQVVGVKEASGSLIQMSEILKRCPKGFCLLAGDDQIFLPVLSIGGAGIVSVASNIVPKEMSGIYDFYGRGEIAKAQDLFKKIFQLTLTLFVETNPIPVKTALHLMGFIENEFRLPLCSMGDENLARLKAVLSDMGLV